MVVTHLFQKLPRTSISTDEYRFLLRWEKGCETAAAVSSVSPAR